MTTSSRSRVTSCSSCRSRGLCSNKWTNLRTTDRGGSLAPAESWCKKIKSATNAICKFILHHVLHLYYCLCLSAVFFILYILSSELNNIFGLTVRKNWGKKIANNVVVQKFVTRCKLQSSKTGETCIKTIISYSNADLNSL